MNTYKKKTYKSRFSKQLRIIIFMLWIMIDQVSALFNFRSKSSTIQIDTGSGLVLERPINYCQGQIVKQKGASLLGQSIFFEQGIFEDAGNRMKIQGNLRSDEYRQIRLTGDQRFKGKGASIAQTILISGKRNRLEGDLLLADDIKLLDANSGVTCALLRSLNKNIQLNGGTLRLDEDLYFLGDNKIIGSGLLRCNNRSIVLGAVPTAWTSSLYFENVNSLDLGAYLQLSQTWTFSGTSCCVNGNGFPLEFTQHGAFVVDRGSTLSIKNAVLTDVTAQSILCRNDQSKIIFEDVIIVQAGDYVFSRGAFEIEGSLELQGTATFYFSPQTTCTIRNNAQLHVGPGMTFCYDSPVNNKKQLYFADYQAELFLNNASLVVTSTGMVLETGSLLINGASSLIIQQDRRDNVTLSDLNGLRLGNGTDPLGDCALYITPGSSLHVMSGLLSYYNMIPESLGLDNPLTSLVIHKDGLLALYQPCILSGGRLQLSEGASLLNFSGQSIAGSVEIYKE